MVEGIKKSWGLLVFEGVLFILFGGLAIILPGLMTLGVELIIGWLFLLGGVIQFFRNFKSGRGWTFALTLLTSVLSMVVGVLLLMNPLEGILTLTLVLTLFFIFEGVSKILLSFQYRKMNNWGWLLFSGVIALAMAAIIFSGWPGTAAWVIGLLVGINMMFFGFSLIGISMAAKKGNLAPA